VRRLYIAPVAVLLWFGVACHHSSSTPVYSNASLSYPKFYEKYSFDELSVASYKYLERVGFSEDDSQTEWYRDKIDRFLQECRTVWGDPNALFPRSEFSEVIFVGSRFGPSGRALSKSEVSALLEIVNDPRNFDWSETTPTFFGRVVFRLTVSLLAS
jgi:hypothetical protein